MPDDRKRIRVACDACRRKKIKCDGKVPCSHCKSANEQVCHYAERQPKKQRNLGARDSKLLLSARMERLEEIILDLSDRLGGLTDARDRIVSGRPSNLDSEDSDDSAENGDATYSRVASEAADGNTSGNKKGRNALPLKNLELFFGAHSFASVVSKSSIDWMIEQVGDENKDLIQPLSNMPLLFQSKTMLFYAKWIDPPALSTEKKQKLMTRPFPENSTLVFGILDMFMTPILRMEGVGDIKRIRGMFEKYYNGKQRFSLAELLTMTVSLAFLIFMRFETNVGPLEQVNDGTEWSDKSLRQLEDTLMNNAIFFYHRLSVVGGGIDTIEAILLFTGYLECHWYAPEVNYMLLVPAIRYAQDMGLHRIESYEMLDVDTASYRKRIWWVCCYMDMEICFRNGKSPIINRADVSPELLDIDVAEIAVSETPLIRSLHKYFSNVLLIRARSYEWLFSATADVGDFASLLRNLDALNEELFATADKLPPSMKPVFFNDTAFHIVNHKDKVENETSWAVRLTFFYHIMLINRLPLMFSFEDEDVDRKAYYLNLSLNSARTMAHLLKSSEGANLSNSFFEWVLFFPSSAFLHLLTVIMKHPKSPEAYSDLMLLIETSMDFLNRRGFDRGADLLSKFQHYSFTLVMFKILLKIVITIFERKTGIVVLEGNPTLQDHLNSARDMMPELFGSVESFRLTVISVAPLVISQSPFVDETKPSPSQSSTSSFSSGKRQLLHPNDPTAHLNSQNIPFSPFPSSGHFQEDIDSLIRAQMKELPNIFFDNSPQF